ncbi:MAG: PhnD/SsuA/transferrin family substrate-binding protein [Gordonibacter sp.]|nr:PhnD/SsuA/transferrin family substrate-binding protein [Gordonibacter sp.]
MIDRRHFIGIMALFGCGVLTSCTGSTAASDSIPLFESESTYTENPSDGKGDSIRVAFAALVSPQESFYKYQNLVNYLEGQIGRKIEVVRRQTYQEVNDMLETGEVDFGFICSLSYVMGLDEGTLTGIAVPIVGGSSFYRSYLICHSDSGLSMLEDLKEKTFAFTDPLSYTGRLSMLKLLHDQVGCNEEYFREVFYTYSHDSSIHAVHLGIVDAASVDGLIYEELVTAQSDLVSNVNVIYKGPAAGMPPVVASTKADEGLQNEFQKALLGMATDEAGKPILKELGYDQFEVPNDDNYEVIRDALIAIGREAVDEFEISTKSEA